MDDYKVGDELASVKLLQPISLANLNESHIKADRHKVRMTVHPKGVLLERDNGETWLIYDASIQAALKKPKAVEKTMKKSA